MIAVRVSKKGSSSRLHVYERTLDGRISAALKGKLWD
jgi:hypothetical protein